MQQTTTNRKKNLTFTLTATAMLTAMIVVLAFTPIGYIRVFALSITLVIVPVIIGAIALGPAAGAFLGFVFGCTSFAQCFMGDALGAILISVSPVGTFVNCVVTRTLVGFLCGLIYKKLQNSKFFNSQHEDYDLVKWKVTNPEQETNETKICINKRVIWKSIVFTFLSLGIYGIYWHYLLVKNVKALKNDTSKCAGEMACLILVPFYSLYWWYKSGETVKRELSTNGYDALGKGNVYLILSAFGLGIVSMAIMQDDFNSLKTEEKKYVTYSALCFPIAGASGALLNTILFLGCLALIFGRVKFTAEQAESLGGLDSVMSTIMAIAIGVNCPIEIAVCAIFGSAIGGAVTAAMKRFSK